MVSRVPLCRHWLVPPDGRWAENPEEAGSTPLAAGAEDEKMASTTFAQIGLASAVRPDGHSRVGLIKDHWNRRGSAPGGGA